MKALGWLCVAGFAAALEAQAPHEWRGWDHYQVILWSTGGLPSAAPLPRWIGRLKELGFTAEERPPEAASGGWAVPGFGFYVDSMIPELGFHNARAPIYRRDREQYEKTRDKRFLTRNPSFEDPAFWEKIGPKVEAMVRRHAANQPLLYNLRDEPSLGSFTSPMDYSFDRYTLRAFREWLKTRYGSLEALNREWETSFSRWDDVTPFTTYEIKARERAGRRENYAPWADHREFMDISFAGALDRLRRMIHRIDPATPVGIAGVQMAGAFGGYDLWRLSRAVDWVEPYNIAGSRKILESFLPAGAPVLATVFGSDTPRIRRQLWWLVLHQDRGAVVWDDENSRCLRKDAPDLPATQRGRDLAPLWAELKAVAPKIFGLRAEHGPIAVHYSQASIRAHWMLDSREDGDTWIRRLASYEAAHSGLAQVRESFTRALEDLGLDYSFVSYEQIENGELIHKGYKVLLLPQSIAMSREECRRVEEFVRAGGTVIADNMAATMDEHCRRLPAGQLDALFGIRGSASLWRKRGAAGRLQPAAGSAAPIEGFDPDIQVTSAAARERTAQGVPVLIEKQTGKGRTVYLNLDMHDYGRLRLDPPSGGNYLDLFSRLLKESGIGAPLPVRDAAGRPVPCVGVWRFAGPRAEYVAVMRNLEPPDPRAKPADGLERPARIRLTLPGKVRVKELRTGRDLGATGEVEFTLDPWSPAIFELGRR
jgi:hypothetical protein